MSDATKTPPRVTERGARAAAARQEKLAAALRANLLRRKAQSRDPAGTGEAARGRPAAPPAVEDG